MYQFPILITIITLFIYQILSLNVSRSRQKNKILSPATTGNIDFERSYRSHINFLENMVIFLPLVWINNMFFSKNIFFVVACILWITGRLVFSLAYIKNLDLKIKISASATAVLSTLILLTMGVIGIFAK